MNALVLAGGAAALYLIAYYSYGRFLARKIFRIDPGRVVPSRELQDDRDFVPAKRSVLFGHHFTSIAGTGPIVGPAIAIIWGWVPALVWVLFGSVLMGAVHDFGALVVSLRNRGRTIGDLAGDVITPRVRILFLLIIFFALWIVVAIFGVVIAVVFNLYPQAVIPVWLEVPIALWLGFMVYRKGARPLPLSILAVCLLYGAVYLGTKFPVSMPQLFGLSPVAVWVVILLVYAYIASVLPVQTLLQPRDYINSHQLFVTLALLAGGVIVARPAVVAPAVDLAPVGAPPLLPMLFVVVACGAISGFHSLVSSGTSSKQCESEGDAQAVGYGSMLMEGMLAVLVIVACGAGIGMGLEKGGTILVGQAAFSAHYASWAAAKGLGSKLGAFITGSANMIESLGLPHGLTMAVMGVFVVSFAATTLDTATRLQRYVVGELGRAIRVPALTGKHPATMVAVATALLLAFHNGSGKGALVLWPLFGATNQLLAGLALLVITVYLVRRGAPVVYTLVPMVFMLAMTGWAMVLNLETFYGARNRLLFWVGFAVFALEVWMVIESLAVLRRVYGTVRETTEPGWEVDA